MPEHTLDEQLTEYLTDVHSIEEQALAQMRLAPRVAGDAQLRRIFAEHLDETREHERLVREQLDRRGASPSAVKDVAGRVGGWGMILFARVNPDTPGTRWSMVTRPSTANTARRSGQGLWNGWCSHRRPSVHSSPSGAYSGLTEKPPDTASRMPCCAHHSSTGVSGAIRTTRGSIAARSCAGHAGARPHAGRPAPRARRPQRDRRSRGSGGLLRDQ